LADELNLNDLNLVDEQVKDVESFDNLPEGGGAFPKPPQPGTYLFTLPTQFTGRMFETIQTPADGARVRVHFEDDKQLKMEDGKTFRCSITNVARVRNKEGGKSSDLALLLKNGLGETAAPKTNVEYARALAKHAGESFLADVELSGRCSPDRDIYKDGKRQEGVKGCGTEFRMDSYVKKNGQEVYAIPQAGGQWATEFQCPNPKCLAVIRAFANLNRFRSTK
jgi:hypothetical protein